MFSQHCFQEDCLYLCNIATFLGCIQNRVKHYIVFVLTSTLHKEIKRRVYDD